MNATRDGVVLVHSSDLHIDDLDTHVGPKRGQHGLVGLAAVLALARAQAADLVLLAGDTFDNARIATPVLRQAAELLAGAGRPVVMLPGNHDALQPDCLFRRAGILDLPHVAVLGATHADTVLFDALGLEIIGRAHHGDEDFPPLGPARPRRARFQVAMAHGHYVPEPEWEWHAHRSWRISDAALAGAGADYVALGHWDRAVRVGPDGTAAFYSGSPDLAGSANLVRLTEAGVGVTREVLRA